MIEGTDPKDCVPCWMVLSCLSIGPHGEAFAAAFVILDAQHRELDEAFAACKGREAAGGRDGRQWCASHVPPLRNYVMSTPADVRDWFWGHWKEWKDKGARLAVFGAWPVEQAFLSQCVADDPSRTWDGPTDLIDVASVMFAAGENPSVRRARSGRELPLHDPVADARHVARLFREASARIALADERAATLYAAQKLAPAAWDKLQAELDALCCTVADPAE